MHPPLRIDAPARPVTEGTTPTRDPLASSGGLDVALYLLDKPDFLKDFSVRRLADAVERAPSTVSNTLKALRDDHLVDERNRPIVPDLFQAVLRHWQTQRLPLAGMPGPARADSMSDSSSALTPHGSRPAGRSATATRRLPGAPPSCSTPTPRPTFTSQIPGCSTPPVRASGLPCTAPTPARSPSPRLPPLLLNAPADSVVVRTLLALHHLPVEPAWVLIGGVAVFLRLGTVTRPTADGDAIARSQQQLLDQLLSDTAVTVITGGKLSIETSHGPAKVASWTSPTTRLRGTKTVACSLSPRRAALVSAARTRILVPDAGLDVWIPLATTTALTALKTVSVVRRPHGDHPTKVGSDIHDLVRLVATGADRIAAEVVGPQPRARHLDRGAHRAVFRPRPRLHRQAAPRPRSLARRPRPYR